MTMITGIQIIGIVIAVAILYEARALYKETKFKRRDFEIWAAVSLALLFVSLFPGLIDYSLRYLKIRRALDVLLIFSIFGAYVLLFQIYIKIQETERHVTDVVRKVALKFEEKK